MKPAHHGVPRSFVRLVLATLVVFIAAMAADQTTAHAQVVADPDHWKQTTEHRNTVYRFVYGQSPQAIPASYDPVREAEEILRRQQRTLPPSNPEARRLWSQVRAMGAKAGLSVPLRALGTVGLVVGTFEIGWKIGTGINAKFLKIGIPEWSAASSMRNWTSIRWRQARSRSFFGAYYPAQDGWLINVSHCCNGSSVDRWAGEPCPVSGLVPPAPFITQGPEASTARCAAPDGGYVAQDVYYGWAPEDALTPTGPIEEYTSQPYSRSSAAPRPPSQTAVEQAVDSELDKPDNELLRQWLNYQLGSPGEQDPTGDGVNVPQPAAAPGDAAETFVQQLEGLGLTNVKFKVLSTPDFDPAFREGAVVSVSPSPGTSVEPGEEIVVTVNRTAQRQNNGECDRSPRQDPGLPPAGGDEFALKDAFSGRDPDQGMAATDVPFRWGTESWGYRHVEIGHGWDNDRDRTDTQAALLDPAPEPDQPGSHRFYFFYMGPNRTPCTRRVVARFDVRVGEPAERGIITSFAHPGWYRRSDFN